MNTFTYAAKVKPLDEYRKEELEAADKMADAYAQQAGQIYDDAVNARRDAARQQAAETGRSYDQQFDINAAQQLAGERRLKEQMANMGLLKSGYNAANQTALALQRSRADAAARTARQAAVDAIVQNLQQYEAETRQKQAAEDLSRRQKLDTAAENTAYKLYTAEQEEAAALRKLVDTHNANLHKLMYNAYKSGNDALGREYAAQLWQIGEDGVVRQGGVSAAGDVAQAGSRAQI